MRLITPPANETERVTQVDIPIKRRRSIVKRLNWSNIITVFFVMAIVALFATWFFTKDNYEVTYVEYQMQENDSLMNVVQDNNDFMPWGWDARNFVELTKEKNNITNVGDIRAGEVILIPITTEGK